MAEDRTDRGSYDVWADFAAAHDIEGIILHELADVQAEGGVPQPPSSAPAVVDARTQEEVDDAVPLDEHAPTVDVTEGMTEGEVTALAYRLTRVAPRLVGRRGVTSVIAFGVTDKLRDLWCEAWDHYMDHGCEAGARSLDMLLEQLIEAFHVAREQTTPRGDA